MKYCLRNSNISICCYFLRKLEFLSSVKYIFPQHAINSNCVKSCISFIHFLFIFKKVKKLYQTINFIDFFSRPFCFELIEENNNQTKILFLVIFCYSYTQPKCALNFNLICT